MNAPESLGKPAQPRRRTPLGHASGNEERLLQRLPEFYRENPNLLGPFLQIAEEMLMECRFHQLDKYREWDARAALTATTHWIPQRTNAESHRAAVSSLNSWDSPRAVRCWLRQLGVVAAEFWTGFLAVERGRDVQDVLALHRSRSARAVVLALSREEVTRPGDLRPPAVEQLPVGVRVQALVCSPEALTRAPWDGRELRGRLLWDVSTAHVQRSNREVSE